MRAQRRAVGTQRRTERGSALLVAVAGLAVLLSAFVALAVVGSALAGAARADGTADLVALAAAAQGSGAADAVARANGAVVRGLSGEEATTVVRVERDGHVAVAAATLVGEPPAAGSGPLSRGAAGRPIGSPR